MKSQNDFDAKYISSSEVMKILKMNRTELLRARRKGLFPEPITINNGTIILWERKDIEPVMGRLLNATK